MARQVVDRHLASAPARRPWLITAARAGLAALRAARRLTHRAGTATRQTDLELALVGMELRQCLVTGAVPPEDVGAGWPVRSGRTVTGATSPGWHRYATSAAC